MILQYVLALSALGLLFSNSVSSFHLVGQMKSSAFVPSYVKQFYACHPYNSALFAKNKSKGKKRVAEGTGGFAEVTEAKKENIATETGNLQEEHDRIAAEKAAEEARMAEVNLKEEERIAAEKAAVEEEAK